MDFTKLWNPRYLLGPNPLDLSRSDYIFFWIAVGFVVVGIIAKLLVLREEYGSPRRILLGRLYHLFATMGVLVLIWVGFRFENIPWLSTHFLALLLLLICLVWLGFIAKYFFMEFLRQQKIWADELLKRKYLPR